MRLLLVLITIFLLYYMRVHSVQLYGHSAIYGSTRPSVLSRSDCLRVTQEMVAMRLTFSQTALLPIPAHHKMICRKKRSLTCCSPAMEKMLFKKSKDEFSSVYRKQFQKPIDDLSEIMKQLSNTFQDVIRRSYNSLNRTLTLALPTLYSPSDRLAPNLFRDLITYLTDPSSNLMIISQRVDLFVDILFSRLACSLVSSPGSTNSVQTSASGQHQQLFSSFSSGSWPLHACPIAQCAVTKVLQVSPELGPKAFQVVAKLTDSLRIARAVMNGLGIALHVLTTLQEKTLFVKPIANRLVSYPNLKDTLLRTLLGPTAWS